MTFWRGMENTPKAGLCGTVADDGSVPDSIEITQAEYDAWLAAQPVPVPVITQLQTDISALNFASLADAKTQLQAILERVRSGER